MVKELEEWTGELGELPVYCLVILRGLDTDTVGCVEVKAKRLARRSMVLS